MQYGLTIPLQKHLKIKTVPCGEEADFFYCWELHIIRLQGRAMLVAINVSSRFGVVLWGMKAPNWKMLEETMENGIRSAFLSEGYTEEQIKTYFQQAGQIAMTKTHGRRSVATLNRMIEYLKCLPIPMDKGELFQSIHSYEINRELCHATAFSDYGLPIEFLEGEMKRTGMYYDKKNIKNL